ncbi:MAG: ABC transporter ATP-binding protein [Alphaproteobacteria bacterium]|nr:ABC transporter ATP-binding protein [Alphaproteobacteria bacterium]MBV8410734.1 ABC transporter ATP-binding protein [Alphaproteobacteria bacterium]
MLAARNLAKTYDSLGGTVHALRGIDFELARGDFVVLLGPSGSGKSTLLNVLGGLDRPTAGRLLFGDTDIARLDERGLTRYRRHHIGFVFQAYNLLSSLTAVENVALGAIGAQHPLAPEAALDLVGIGGLGDRFPAELSGGEQQRVAVARAIAKQPALLLCDEPTGALDSKTGAVVLEAIDAVNRQFATATVLVTHNAVIAAMADRVVHLADGGIVRIEDNAARASARELSW